MARNRIMSRLTALGAALVWMPSGAFPQAAAPPPEPERAMPTLISQSFDQVAEALRFQAYGAGTWEVANGVFALQHPKVLTDADPGNGNLAVQQTALAVAAWDLASTAQVAAGGTTHDLSIVFNFLDEANYAWVNFSDRTGPNTAGIFVVENGVQQRLAILPATLSPGASHTVALRFQDGVVKAYLDRSYLAKATVKTFASTRIGYGSRGGEVQFDNLKVQGEGAVPDPSPNPNPDPPTPPPPPSPPPEPVPPGTSSRQIPVATTAQLQAAFLDARPGDVITLADGTYGSKKGMASPIKVGGKTYTGTFTATRAGTAASPILLQGSSQAIINGGSLGGQYGLYFVNGAYWTLKGFTVTNVAKGIVMDGCNHMTLDGLEVFGIGQEGIHLRSMSSDNLVTRCSVHDTGMKTAAYGEGIYVGSANSNWGTYTGGLPDRSDRNQLIANTIAHTRAENMDIKEGTTGGLIQNNHFDGADMTGSWADSWIDLKGNGWKVIGNQGVNALQDGFQVHGNHLKALGDWGNNNTFSGNIAAVQGPGYGFWLQNNVSGNVIACSNVVTGAASGFATVPCATVGLGQDPQHPEAQVEEAHAGLGARAHR